MSDLVSRKALEKAIRDYADDIGCKRGEKELANGVLMSLSKVRNAPIAYDVDKVVEAIKFKQYFDELYGTGLEVANWHLNGDLEPFDDFYESALQEGAVKDD